jgi:hypothetical protein
MRRKRRTLTPDTLLAPVPAEILDQFVRQGPISAEELDAAVRRLQEGHIERALGGELTHHLGYPAGGSKPDDTMNRRNRAGEREDGADRRRTARPRRATRSRGHVRAAAHCQTRAAVHGLTQFAILYEGRFTKPAVE